MLRILLLFCIIICVQQLDAQKSYTTRKTTTEKALKFYNSGRKSAKVGDYEKALKFYEKALDQDANFIDAKAQIANLKYDQGDFADAKKRYTEVIEIAPDFSKSIYYSLALSDWKAENYGSAVEGFKKYLTFEKTNERRIQSATKYIQNGSFIAKAKKNPVPFNPQKLTSNINLPNAQEYLPVISVDDQSMIFTRNESGQEDFFVSKKTPEGWSEAQPITSINTSLNEGAQTMSADGKLFIFTACNRQEGLGRCDLFYSRQIEEDKWTKPRNLGRPINSPAWESQPSLSADGKTLYFVSDRAGKGKRDIFVCKRKKRGWTEPVSLSEVINTPENEQSPYIHPDGKTLYFMSEGHPGMGESDLYFSKKDENDNWSTPQNLGYPINTEEHEGAIFIARDGKTAYFSTNRDDKKQNEGLAINPFTDGNTASNLDIFSFELPEAARATPVTYLKAIVKDADTKKPIQAYAQLTNLSTQKINYNGNTNKSGELLVCIPMGENYGLHIEKPEYTFHSENFSLKEANSLADPFTLEIFLKKIKPVEATNTPTLVVERQPIILKNVFFATASAELRPESTNELLRLKQMLEENPSVRIQINGHTDLSLIHISEPTRPY